LSDEMKHYETDRHTVECDFYAIFFSPAQQHGIVSCIRKSGDEVYDRIDFEAPLARGKPAA
jgi:hypothetical protein